MATTVKSNMDPLGSQPEPVAMSASASVFILRVKTATQNVYVRSRQLWVLGTLKTDDRFVSNHRERTKRGAWIYWGRATSNAEGYTGHGWVVYDRSSLKFVPKDGIKLPRLKHPSSMPGIVQKRITRAFAYKKTDPRKNSPVKARLKKIKFKKNGEWHIRKVPMYLNISDANPIGYFSVLKDKTVGIRYVTAKYALIRRWRGSNWVFAPRKYIAEPSATGLRKIGRGQLR